MTTVAFCSLDSAEQGWTVVVVAESATLADEQATRLATRVWGARQALWDELEKGYPVPEALAMAAAVQGSPVVLTDAADNVGGGAPGDTPGVIVDLLKHKGLLADDELAFLHVPDPDAISLLGGVATGADVVVPVAGKTDPMWGPPVEVVGKLVARADGPIENCAPGGAFGGTGPVVETGKMVCIAVGNVRLVLSETKVQGPHPSIFTAVGLDPFVDAKVVVLKSGTGWEVTYKGKCAEMIRADCPGPQSYNCARFPWEQLSRPIFPLDEGVAWPPPADGGGACL